ncbi:MAG: bacteriohemerythrin [Gammaproteobacteria bacterium]
MIENTDNQFQWSSDFCVGVAELDDDHKILFELLNYLRAMIEGGDASALPAIIDDLQQYTIYHFQHEEEMMLACHYQYLDNHKLVHRMMETRLNEFTKNPGFKGDIQAATWLIDFFEDWLKDHIAGMDKNYSACIQDEARGNSYA